MLWARTFHHSMTKSFRIPDTIIYKKKLPKYWIFMSKKDGHIKSKIERNITKDRITKEFLKTSEKKDE